MVFCIVIARGIKTDPLKCSPAARVIFDNILRKELDLKVLFVRHCQSLNWALLSATYCLSPSKITPFFSSILPLIRQSRICLQCRRPGFDPGSGRSLEKGMDTHSIFSPGKSHGQRILAGYSPWGCKDSDMTE